MNRKGSGTDSVYSVSQINQYIKAMFVRDYVLSRVWIQGEVSNCKYHSSGHIYFTLKDKAAQISCVMFSSYRQNLDFRLEEGRSVIVQGSISVYERDGKYQLYAREITEQGAGRLYEEYEKCKKRLLEEGLFDENRKKKIPQYAAHIGVVTARTGAVIQDICNVSHRRNPYVRISLYPAKVQGEGAAEEIIRGIHYFEETDVDTIIIGRGGGSIEDLWAFNEEKLVRAVADCTKPVISAVGHETDTTLSDYVADMRAPTPSAAAELAVYSYRDFELGLRDFAVTLQHGIRQMIKLKKLCMGRYELALSHLSPQDKLRQKRLYLAECEERLRRLTEQRITSAKHQLALYAEELKGLSPLYKLQAGYSYVADEAGNHIHSVKQLQKGQTLSVTLADGQALVQVKEIGEAEWQKK